MCDLISHVGRKVPEKLLMLWIVESGEEETQHFFSVFPAQILHMDQIIVLSTLSRYPTSFDGSDHKLQQSNVNPGGTH